MTANPNTTPRLAHFELLEADTIQAIAAGVRPEVKWRSVRARAAATAELAYRAGTHVDCLEAAL